MLRWFVLLWVGFQSPQAHADALFQEGRFREAASAYLELLKASPNDMHLLESMGQSLMALGQPKQAVQFFRREVAVAGGNRDASRFLALALTSSNEYEEAGRLLTQLTASDSQDAQSWFFLGLLRYRNGYYEATVDCLRRAKSLGLTGKDGPSEQKAAEVMIAVSLVESGQNADAEKALLAVLARPGQKNLDALLGYTRVLYESGRYEEAFQTTGTALTESPDNAAAHFWRARILLRRGQLPQSAAEAEKASELAPNSPAPHNLLIQIYNRQGRAAEAASEAEWVRRRTGEQAIAGK